MKDYMRKLHGIKLFTLKDVSAITGNENTAQSLLASGTSDATICHIRTNLYGVTDLATGQCAANKFEIASNISETASVAYHSAMEYHGLGHQLFNEMSVISDSTFRTFEFEGITYVRRQPKITEGVMVPVMNSKVRVTDLERTVIDCIDRIKYAGGLEELLNNFTSVAYIDEAKLKAYLDSYGKASLYQKAGFLLSMYKKQWRLSAGFFNHCKSHIGKSTRYLTDVADHTDYVSEWRLCVPENMSNLMEQGGVYV